MVQAMKMQVMNIYVNLMYIGIEIFEWEI